MFLFICNQNEKFDLSSTSPMHFFLYFLAKKKRKTDFNESKEVVYFVMHAFKIS